MSTNNPLDFWVAINNMTFTELKDVAKYIHDAWAQRQTDLAIEDTGLEFADALKDYAQENIEGQ